MYGNRKRWNYIMTYSRVRVFTFTCCAYRKLGWATQSTLSVQVFRGAKKSLLLLQHSRSSRDSQDLKQNINSCECFFRKFPFCTFSCINPEFGGPWVMIQKNFLISIFIVLQKNTFGQKKFLNFMHGFKSAILAKMKNCQNGTFAPVNEIQKFF